MMMVQAALEAQARLQGHEQRMAELQKEVDSAQRLMRSAQLQAREAADEKGGFMDKVPAVLCHAVFCCDTHSFRPPFLMAKAQTDCRRAMQSCTQIWFH